jgi:hypothetical protein
MNGGSLAGCPTDRGSMTRISTESFDELMMVAGAFDAMFFEVCALLEAELSSSAFNFTTTRPALLPSTSLMDGGAGRFAKLDDLVSDALGGGSALAECVVDGITGSVMAGGGIAGGNIAGGGIISPFEGVESPWLLIKRMPTALTPGVVLSLPTGVWTPSDS